MDLPGGRFHPEPQWQYMVFRSQEAERGLDPHSDLFSPGYFEAALYGGQTVAALAEVAAGPAASGPAAAEIRRPVPAGRPAAPAGCPPIEILEAALDAYVVRRGELKTVIAGYPWFLDWGRDSLIFVRGLVAAGRFEDARAVLRLFGQFEENGTLPNMIRGADAGNRETSDAPLWFAVACNDLIAAEGHTGFLKSPCGNRPVRKVLESIVQGYLSGTKNGVRMDPGSGLVYSPSHFTWMDTNYPAGSPRQGYPVEIQALWHAALCLMARIDRKNVRRWEDLAAQVRESLTALFWRPSEGFLSDCLHAEPGQPAGSARADDALRPNQLLAVTLGTIDSGAPLAAGILTACEELLVPGAIRSLADRPVAHAMPVTHNGALLNDPHRPYRGSYSGDEDTSRKPAYHNGTAWTWPFPSYCEALAMTAGEEGRRTGLALLTSSIKLLETGCLGHLPEILDGDRPHTLRGCDAQAWGVSEWVRVWRKLAG
jgi:glycogen debranching enzyme